MALRFIGKDPDSPNNGSPTVWLDEADGSIVIQGWRIADESALAEITADKPIPDHETVIRLLGLRRPSGPVEPLRRGRVVGR